MFYYYLPFYVIFYLSISYERKIFLVPGSVPSKTHSFCHQESGEDAISIVLLIDEFIIAHSSFEIKDIIRPFKCTYPCHLLQYNISFKRRSITKPMTQRYRSAFISAYTSTKPMTASSSIHITPLQFQRYTFCLHQCLHIIQQCHSIL